MTTSLKFGLSISKFTGWLSGSCVLFRAKKGTLVSHFMGQYVSLLDKGKKDRGCAHGQCNFLCKLRRLPVTNPTIKLMCPAVRPSICQSTFWFPDSNSKMLSQINLKLNGLIGHHQDLVAFEIGVGVFGRLGVHSHPKYFGFQTLT